MEMFSLIASIIDPVRILVIFITLVMYTELSSKPNTPFIVIFTTLFSSGIAWFSYTLITSHAQSTMMLAIGTISSFVITMLMARTLFRNVLCSPKDSSEAQTH